MPKSRAEKKAIGQFFSHHQLVKFILTKINPTQDNPVMLDPSCGEGIFLIEFLAKFPNATVVGIDIDQHALTEAKNQLKSLITLNEQIKIGSYHLICHDGLCPTSELHLILEKEILSPRFDYILGNPPFFILKNSKIMPSGISTYDEFGPIISSNTNIASLFLYRYLQMLKPGGQLFFIFPRSILHVESFRKLRQVLLQYHITHIFDIGKAFPDVGLEQIIIGITNNTPALNSEIHYGLLSWNPLDEILQEILIYTIPQSFWNLTPKFFLFIGQTLHPQVNGLQIYQKIQKYGNKTITDFCVSPKKLGIDPIFRGWGYQRQSSDHKINENDILVYGGRNIFNFGIKNTCRYLPYSYIASKLKLKRNYAMISYPKILIQNLASSKIRLVAAFDEQKYENLHNASINYRPTFDTITNIIPLPEFARFILAVLTSELCTYYCRDFIFLRQTLTLHVDKKYLMQIPFPTPKPEELRMVNEIVIELEDFVSKLNIQKPVADRQRPSWENITSPEYTKYNKIKIKLDQVIYQMFNLTDIEQDFIHLQLKEFDEKF